MSGITIKSQQLLNCQEIQSIFKKHGMSPKIKLTLDIECGPSYACYYVRNCTVDIDNAQLNKDLTDDLMNCHRFTQIISN